MSRQATTCGLGAPAHNEPSRRSVVAAAGRHWAGTEVSRVDSETDTSSERCFYPASAPQEAGTSSSPWHWNRAALAPAAVHLQHSRESQLCLFCPMGPDSMVQDRCRVGLASRHPLRKADDAFHSLIKGLGLCLTGHRPAPWDMSQPPPAARGLCCSEGGWWTGSRCPARPATGDAGAGRLCPAAHDTPRSRLSFRAGTALRGCRLSTRPITQRWLPWFEDAL